MNNLVLRSSRFITLHSADQMPFFLDYNVRECRFASFSVFVKPMVDYILFEMSQYLIDCLHSG
ncbi:hypothetical protein VCHA37P200_90038 [Vibrio chagasii]|nr:hypothetical protein VCHA53O468_70037 [Vibrio chagasii]CAH7471098.1 hypothetical protein VCHA37P200_90038 [Vibrio chagasii]